MQIAGSTTVITGGASGLGRATAERLHGGGGAVVLLDLAQSPGAQVAAALGERALFAPADVTNPDEVTAALEAAVARFGAVTALVNCAGIGTADKTFGKRGPADLAGFARTIQVNLIGTFNCIRLAAAQMAKNAPNAEGERGVVDQHRLGRRLRRPDRPGRLLRLQGRRGRHDAADRARPGRAGHPRHDHRARPLRDAACWRGLPEAARVVAGQAGALPAPARAGRPSTPRSPPTSSRTRCSTARRSGSTAPSACSPADAQERPCTIPRSSSIRSSRWA